MDHSRPQSRKRTGRLRIGRSVISMPDDLQMRLNRQADIGRYESKRSCMYKAIEHGLSVMEILEKRVGTIVYNVANNQTHSDTGEVN